jgi:hypothetical protein
MQNTLLNTVNNDNRVIVDSEVRSGSDYENLCFASYSYLLLAFLVSFLKLLYANSWPHRAPQSEYCWTKWEKATFGVISKPLPTN